MEQAQGETTGESSSTTSEARHPSVDHAKASQETTCKSSSSASDGFSAAASVDHGGLESNHGAGAADHTHSLVCVKELCKETITKNTRSHERPLQEVSAMQLLSHPGHVSAWAKHD